MDMRAPRSGHSQFVKFIAWAVLILGLLGSIIGVSELDVIATVYSLIVVTFAGVFLLKLKALSATRVERIRDPFTGR